jgi:long-chain acyl-CoA synthetase
MNIASILEKAAFYFPHYIAVIDNDKPIHFNQFNRDASRVASALHGRGIRPGDHVALCAPNSYAWLAFYFGVLRVGAVAVTFSHLLTKNELAKILLDCKPKAMLTADQKLADLSEIQKQARPGLIVCENGDISFDRLAAEGTPGFKIVHV